MLRKILGNSKHQVVLNDTYKMNNVNYHRTCTVSMLVAFQFHFMFSDIPWTQKLLHYFAPICLLFPIPSRSSPEVCLINLAAFIICLFPCSPAPATAVEPVTSLTHIGPLSSCFWEHTLFLPQWLTSMTHTGCSRWCWDPSGSSSWHRPGAPTSPVWLQELALDPLMLVSLLAGTASAHTHKMVILCRQRVKKSFNKKVWEDRTDSSDKVQGSAR